MRIQDRNFRRSLAQIAGVLLITAWAAGIADSMAFSSDDAAAIPAASSPASSIARDDVADAASQAAGAARARRIGRYADADSSAAATVANKRTDDAEIALLLDWHQDANNVTGARDPEEMPHSN